MVSLVGSQWLPITVESWSQKIVLKKAKKKWSLFACNRGHADIHRCNYLCFSVHACLSAALSVRLSSFLLFRLSFLRRQRLSATGQTFLLFFFLLKVFVQVLPGLHLNFCDDEFAINCRAEDVSLRWMNQCLPQWHEVLERCAHLKTWPRLEAEKGAANIL